MYVGQEPGAGLVRFKGIKMQAVAAGQGNRLQGAAKAEVEPDPGTQLVGVERLHHVIVGPRGEGPDLLAARRFPREHHDLNGPAARNRANAAAGLVAVDAGHDDIEHHQVGGKMDSVPGPLHRCSPRPGNTPGRADAAIIAAS